MNTHLLLTVHDLSYNIIIVNDLYKNIDYTCSGIINLIHNYRLLYHVHMHHYEYTHV